ncbi:phosphomannomutase [Cognatishimia sp. F0-27]|uniref:phosphomannomutase n=1 Tax=Cognatishimia sp. F0-27 TaxID=2816855 RepID=UPI001D0C8058|nr:phosphomannomutase [Cognatishimia sp. F0-27]MCC1494751.1 phosphomannomutase [Cognatishimia sp. F0-27]
MAPKFGTSGLRGLVVELTDALVADYTRAFLDACPQGATLCLGRDLRPSSAGIADVVCEAARAAGMDVVDCGALPTPALALEAARRGAGAVMVTGSHIPADRNGLKFYTPAGEIGKGDEAAILDALGAGRAPDGPVRGRGRGRMLAAPGAGAAWVARYAGAFGPAALSGLRIGIYQHSSVARDLMVAAVQALGAVAVPLARSETFIPVDTEALDPETGATLAGWVGAHGLDAVISTDGDADRPMLALSTGRVIPGDLLGALTARALEATVIVTPVSANSLIEDLEGVTQVHRTKIGSPYVIAAMEDALAADPDARVVGFEPNGGFLLGFAAQGPEGPLAPLMTRDCLLPMLAPLVAARNMAGGLSALVAGLPPVFTAADRLQGIAPEVSRAFIATLTGDAAARAAFFEAGGAEDGLDLTDGLRVRFAGGAVVHLRPSGNAPELRCYAEAGSPEAAADLVARHLDRVRARLG